MDCQTRRPWGLALFSALAVFAALAYMNLDGYHNEPFGGGDLNGEPPNINWKHGWPWPCLGRLSIDTNNSAIRLPYSKVPLTSRWPFDDTPPTYFYWAPFVADLSIIIGLVIGTWFGVDRSVSPNIVPRRFGLKFLFGLTTLAAILLAFDVTSHLTRHASYRIAEAVILLGVILTLRGLVSLVFPFQFPAPERAART